MIISKKKYKKLNDDLVDAKAKVDDAKKALDDENKITRVSLLIKKQRDQYKAERDTLIDDIAVLKANNSRLERENEKLRAEKFGLKLDLIESIKLSEGFLKRYEQLTNHIRLKAENNPGVSRYIDLVNYIDRLEDKESDTTHHIPHLTNINIKDNTEEPMKFIKRIAKERD